MTNLKKSRTWIPCLIAFVGSASVPAFAATTAKMDLGNLKVPAHKIPAPQLATLLSTDDAMIAQDTVSKSGHTGRKIASGGEKVTGSEDLMSPALKEFRDKLVQQREAEGFNALLADYDSKYDSLPNDLKYVMARYSPVLALRGFIWRMTPLVHQTVVVQEGLLGMLRGVAEQIGIDEPDTQWKAYVAFLTIPNAALLQKPADQHDGVKRSDKAFYVENDLAAFLSGEVYPALAKAVARLQKLKMTQEIDGKEVMIVFDNRVRFGDKAFNENYDAQDRFRFVGDGERYAAIARFERRMAMISQIAAYNWNGNVAFRKELGKKYGIDADISGGLLGLNFNGPLGISGLTREDRVKIVKNYPKLYTLQNAEWMKAAYHHLRMFTVYLGKAWNVIRADRENYEMILDPDFFQGKREQSDKAVANLQNLFPVEKGESNAVTIQGAVTGDTLQVNLKAFFLENPPKDLKALMPTRFNHHQDILGLSQVYGADNISMNDDDSVVTMKIGDNTTEWRNYFYGRAVGWDLNQYASLFPGLKSDEDVARAQRILAEARGGRPLLNTLNLFIK